MRAIPTENTALAESGRVIRKAHRLQTDCGKHSHMRDMQYVSMPVRIIGVNDTEWAYVTTCVNEGGTADNSVPLVWDWGLFFCPELVKEAHALFRYIYTGGKENV